MNTIFVILFTTFLWFCALLQGTGIGNLVDVTEKVNILLIGISTLLIIHKQFSWRVKSRSFISWIGTILVFGAIPYLIKSNTDGTRYLIVFLIVFILSQFSITEKCIKWVAWIYGVLGAMFLLVYNTTSILSGWNENAIAMIAFFSYSIWIIYGISNGSKLAKVITIMVTSVYLLLLEITDARSSTLFVIIGLLLMLNVIKFQKLFSGGGYKILLFVPLIIAISSIIISKLPLFEYLEAWSYKEFQKPLFNGRDQIWGDGFDMLFTKPFIGVGKLINGWHNSAITCLVAYGMLGYLLWINLFANIIDKGQEYIQERHVYGAVIAFFLIYLQQSVELGLIGTNPNFIPYVALGVMLGRIKYLKKCHMSRSGK